MADPTPYIKRFRRNCIQKPPSPPTPLWKTWLGPYGEYTVQRGESLKSIAGDFATDGRATIGLDWRQLALFNFGVDRPPYVNWCLIERFDFDEKSNLTRDHKNYMFDGAGDEVIKVPFREGAAAPGAVARHVPNTVVIKDVEVAAVEGPTFYVEKDWLNNSIYAKFRVTGYSVDRSRVTDAMRAAVKWKVKDLDTGSETVRPERGEEVQLNCFTGLGKRYRVYPYLKKSSELVRCELRVIRVELKHEIKLTEVDEGEIHANDPINKIHNPAGVVIGAADENTCARVRLTKVEPADVNLASNDPGFTWRVSNTQGQAAFRPEPNAEPDTNIGSECELYGVAAGLFKLQGYATYSVTPCVELTLKAVPERQIPYRANFLSRPFLLLFSRSTGFTPQKVSDCIAIANIHLRQVGIRLVPDTDNSVYRVGEERIESIPGRPGYFEISRVPSEYVENINWADAEKACRINSRSGVVNFNFVISYSGGAWGLGPCCPYNLFSTSYTGPDETGTNKTSNVFDTPANLTSSEVRAGILIMDPTIKEAANDTKIGAVLAHELGHNLAMWHRGTAVGGDSRDGLPMSFWNLMYAFVNRGADQDTQTDADLIQLAITRSSALAPGNSGNLVLAADTLSVKGASLTTHRVNLTAKRGAAPVANTRFKYWATPFNTAIANVGGTNLPATGISATGRMWMDIRLMGNPGDKASILVMAGEKDDLVTEMISCEVT